jgi:hypothetical protein
MSKFITGKLDFSAIPEEGWPVLGSYIVAFDTADSLLKKMDSTGFLTILEGGSLAATLSIGRDSDSIGIIKDFSSANTIHLNSRLLIDSGGIIESINWDFRYLHDSVGTVSADWETRVLKDSSLTPTLSLDWENRSLSGNWTAATQSPGDNSTKLATTAYVDNLVVDFPDITTNYIPKGTGTSITDGTWYFSGNDLVPTIDASNIGSNGSPQQRIGTIYMASNIDYLSTLSFNEGGAEKVHISSGGNVGIGTSGLSYDSKLSIAGPGASNFIKFYNASGTERFSLRLNAGESTEFDTNNGDYYFKKTTGTLFSILGTGVAAERTLTVTGNADGQNIYIGKPGGSGIRGQYYINTAEEVVYAGLNTELLFYTGSGGADERMRITQSGNVSIGHGAIPGARLHIKGSGNNSATTAFKVVNSDSINLLSVDDAGNIAVRGGRNFEFRGGGNTYLQMYEGGNLNINTYGFGSGTVQPGFVQISAGQGSGAFNGGDVVLIGGLTSGSGQPGSVELYSGGPGSGTRAGYIFAGQGTIFHCSYFLNKNAGSTISAIELVGNPTFNGYGFSSGNITLPSSSDLWNALYNDAAQRQGGFFDFSIFTNTMGGGLSLTFVPGAGLVAASAITGGTNMVVTQAQGCATFRITMMSSGAANISRLT